MAQGLGINPTIGYHAIRGLAAPLRMMMFYKERTFTNASYGADVQDTWFGKKKPELLPKNSCINLPYIIDGDNVVTQSNTCMVYLGGRLGIDRLEHTFRNRTVLDQTMDLRNALMLIVYPFGAIKTKDGFAEGAAKHIDGDMTGNFTKLEGFCAGRFMCGDEPQSGDFHLWEMLHQHIVIAEAIGKEPFLDKFPKLAAMYSAMKAFPGVQKYLASDYHAKYFHNNGLYTHFSGQPDGAVYPASKEEKVELGSGKGILSMPATLHYFPAGGRAELCRLIAAAGRVELIEGGMPGADVDKSDFASPGGVPLLQHGPLKMAQSTAIENYLSLLAFPDLPPDMRAVDAQFCCIKEDVAAGTYKVIFSPMIKEDKEKAAEELRKNASKWYTVVEKLCPANGFMNGQAYPTAADVAVLNMCDTVMSFGLSNRIAGIDWSTYPKMRALATRTAKFPSVAEYLAKSTTFTANPMGL